MAAIRDLGELWDKLRRESEGQEESPSASIVAQYQLCGFLVRRSSVINSVGLPKTVLAFVVKA